MKRVVFGLFLLSGCYINFALAAISVAPMDIEFTVGGNLSQNVQVINEADSIAYVQIETTLISNPGDVHEKNVVIRDPRKLGLLVVPSKLIIPPKQSRFIRLIAFPTSSAKEKVYRVVIKPVSGDLVAVKHRGAKMRMGVHIIIAYGVRVVVGPKVANIKVVMQRVGNIVTVINRGNVNVNLSHGKQCFNSHKCVKIHGRRLYPNNIWTFKVPYRAPVSFMRVHLDSVAKIASN